MSLTEESLKLFKTIFDQTPISTQVFTPDGKTVMVNKAWENLWNAKFEQLTNYNILKDHQLVASGSMPYIKRGFNGEHVNIPAIYYDPTKTVPIEGLTPRWLSARMYPIKNNKGKITHLVLQHEDITDRKHAEEDKQRFVSLIENSTDFIGIADKNQKAIYVNKAGQNLVGLKNEKSVRKTMVMDYFSTTERKRVESDILPVLLEKGYWNGEVKFIHFKTKKEIPVLWNVFLIRDEATGEIQNYACVSRDISDLKKYEEGLRNSEERLRIAVNAGKIGVWDWNIQQNALTWTENVYKIHDVSKNKFKPTVPKFMKLIHPEDVSKVTKAIEKTIKKGDPFQIDFRIVARDGSTRWVTTSAALLYDSAKNPVRLLGATSDITQQKLLEQEKSDFLSMAAHELKTPITSMKMFVELLHRQLSDTDLERPKYFAKRIKDQTDRLTELTNDLLDVSRIETGKIMLHKDKFNYSDMVLDTIEGLQATSKQKLQYIGEKNIKIYADKFRIYQVLVNLITNATKYSAIDQTVKIKIEKKSSNIITYVKDYGIGISKNKHERIFDRLYQVTDPKEKTFPGLGLGLYISKEIIERHNGKIWLKSEKGKGSTFYFSLPIGKK
jgi:PAS domain S-box-containing protein